MIAIIPFAISILPFYDRKVIIDQLTSLKKKYPDMKVDTERLDIPAQELDRFIIILLPCTFIRIYSAL